MRVVKRLFPVLAAVSFLAGACGTASSGDPAAACPREPAAGPADISTAQPLAPLTGGDPLPDQALPLLDGEGCLHTADLRGGPAVINFWATWCVFCVEEMPDLEQVHLELADAVRFIGVDREDDPVQALELARATGVTYELVEDRDATFFRAVQGRGMPTTLLVDADGVIRYRHAGPVTAEQLRELIREHLGV